MSTLCNRQRKINHDPHYIPIAVARSCNGDVVVQKPLGYAKRVEQPALNIFFIVFVYQTSYIKEEGGGEGMPSKMI
jgi:hypothetical protein